MQVTPDEIPAVSRLVHDLCGLTLDASKAYLIDSRLGRLAETAGCTTFTEFVYQARSPNNRALQNEIIDAITTQETLFFRDAYLYDVLQYKVLPDLIDRKTSTLFPRRLRIWSAACSTGQEAYSIAMTLCEVIPGIASWDVNILGTDISNAAVAQASLGRYTEQEIQRGMKPQLLARYFRLESGGWRIKDDLRAMVTFGRRNLLQPFVDLGPFDLIFCRNVAIYFNGETRRNLFLRLAEHLTPDGYLFVGSSECLVDIGPQFVPQHHCRGSYYQPQKVAAPTSAVRSVHCAVQSAQEAGV